MFACIYLCLYGNLQALKIVSVRISNGLCGVVVPVFFFFYFVIPCHFVLPAFLALSLLFFSFFPSRLSCIPFLSSKRGMCRMVFIFPVCWCCAYCCYTIFFFLYVVVTVVIVAGTGSWLVFVRSFSYILPAHFYFASASFPVLCFRWVFW